MLIVHLVTNKIVCTRGDTGLLSIEISTPELPDDTYADFYVFDNTGKIFLKKTVQVVDQLVSVYLRHLDTAGLINGVYNWNCKLYLHSSLVNGDIVLNDLSEVYTLYTEEDLRFGAPIFQVVGVNPKEV